MLKILTPYSLKVLTCCLGVDKVARDNFSDVGVNTSAINLAMSCI